jgi:hypothetical protein
LIDPLPDESQIEPPCPPVPPSALAHAKAFPSTAPEIVVDAVPPIPPACALVLIDATEIAPVAEMSTSPPPLPFPPLA